MQPNKVMVSDEPLEKNNIEEEMNKDFMALKNKKKMMAKRKKKPMDMVAQRFTRLESSLSESAGDWGPRAKSRTVEEIRVTISVQHGQATIPTFPWGAVYYGKPEQSCDRTGLQNPFVDSLYATSAVQSQVCLGSCLLID